MAASVDVRRVAVRFPKKAEDVVQDVFVRLMYGGRISLTVSFIAVILITILVAYSGLMFFIMKLGRRKKKYCKEKKKKESL